MTGYRGKRSRRAQLSAETGYNSHTDAANPGISRRKILFTPFEQ